MQLLNLLFCKAVLYVMYSKSTISFHKLPESLELINYFRTRNLTSALTK